MSASSQLRGAKGGAGADAENVPARADRGLEVGRRRTRKHDAARVRGVDEVADAGLQGDDWQVAVFPAKDFGTELPRDRDRQG